MCVHRHKQIMTNQVNLDSKCPRSFRSIRNPGWAELIKPISNPFKSYLKPLVRGPSHPASWPAHHWEPAPVWLDFASCLPPASDLRWWMISFPGWGMGRTGNRRTEIQFGMFGPRNALPAVRMALRDTTSIYQLFWLSATLAPSYVQDQDWLDSGDSGSLVQWGWPNDNPDRAHCTWLAAHCNEARFIGRCRKCRHSYEAHGSEGQQASDSKPFPVNSCCMLAAHSLHHNLWRSLHPLSIPLLRTCSSRSVQQLGSGLEKAQWLESASGLPH